MLSLSRIATLLVVVLAAVAHGQDQDQYYQDDYSNDNLYHDYAARQNDKEVGAPGMPWGKICAATAMGWFAGGKYHSKKVTKKLNSKHKNDQKELYTQYYNDVYTLKEQNAQLVQALEQMGVAVR